MGTNKIIVPVTLQKLKIENFKGIATFEYDFAGESAEIRGDNATGKTTLYDAFTWLLIGKDSSGATDFSIKEKDETGAEQHNLEHSVEATFVINGTQNSFKKVYKEKYTKKRGAAEAEMTGHITDHYVDGVPVSKKEYTSTIEEFFLSIEDLSLLLNVRAFPTLPWQKQRALLLDICGTISDDDLIASNHALKTLPQILDGHSVEDAYKIIAARRKELNKKLDQIPARIDEAQKSTPEAAPADPQVVEERLKTCREHLKKVQDEIAAAKNGGAQLALKEQLLEQKRVLTEIEEKHNTDVEAAIRRARQQAEKIEMALAVQKDALLAAEREHDKLTAEAKTLEEANDSLREQWKKINLEETFEDEEFCSTCSQPLPAIMIEEAREKYNTDRANKLEVIQRNGKSNKKRLEAVTARLSEIEKEIPGIQSLVDELTQDKKGVTQLELPGVNELVKYREANAKLKNIEKQLEAVNEGSSDIVSKREAEASEIAEEIEFHEKALALTERVKQVAARVAELKQEQKDLGKEYARLEGHLSLLDLFTKIKVETLNEAVAELFKNIRFRMYEEQINGGLKPVCEASLHGVPYQDLNSAGKIQVGLEIIEVLQEHFNCYPPIFVDNAESITSIPEIGGAQMFKLIVDGDYKEIHIEKEGE